jgi:hypothetical protein
LTFEGGTVRRPDLITVNREVAVLPGAEESPSGAESSTWSGRTAA